MASSLSFLASMMLKLNQAQPLTEEESAQLLAIAAAAVSEPAKTANKTTEKTTEKTTTKIQKKIEKASTIERDLLEPVELETPAVKAPSPPTKGATINPSLCQARKVNDKEFIPGTDANKVYLEIQCSRKKQPESDFCKFCAATEEKWRTGGGKEKKWAGRMTDPIPDHIHVVGSAWFKKAYPNGLDALQTVVPPASTDVILDDSAPVQTVAWEAFTFQGTPMIRHMTDGRVYKADMSKDGLERIVFSQYQGRWEDGDLNIYAPEEDDAE